jgi:hypothetical protein
VPDDPAVAVEDEGPVLAGPRLGPAPGDQLVQLGHVVLGEAADDVLFGLEVVVQGGLGDAEPLGDLAQRGLLVPVLREQLEGHGLNPLPGVAPCAPRRRASLVVHRSSAFAGLFAPFHHEPVRPTLNLLDARLVSVLVWCTILAGRQVSPVGE